MARLSAALLVLGCIIGLSAGEGTVTPGGRNTGQITGARVYEGAGSPGGPYGDYAAAQEGGDYGKIFSEFGARISASVQDHVARQLQNAAREVTSDLQNNRYTPDGYGRRLYISGDNTRDIVL